MGRVAIIDNSVSSRLERSSDEWCIGLLIGSHTEQKDFVVHYAATPIEELEDRNKGLSKISDVLVTSHAAEVQRMLPGGLCILGIAAIAPSNVLDSCHIKMQQLILSAFKKLRSYDDACPETWHLFLYDKLTKRLTSKTLDASDYKSSLRPAEVKVQSLKTGWITARSSLFVNQKFNVRLQQQDQHFEQQLLGGLSPFLDSVSESVCILDGKRPHDSEMYGESMKSKKSVQSESMNINVEMLVKSESPSKSKCEEMIASLWIRGTVSAVAFLRCPVAASQITQAMKSDVKKSITVRCQLLCEDILQVGSEKHTLEEQLVYEMPPRVYIPHDSSPIVFSDYMFKDEQLEDCAIRAQQLLGVDGLDCESINSRTERTADIGDIEVIKNLNTQVIPEKDEEMPLSSAVNMNFWTIGCVFSQFEMLPCTYHICGVAEYPCHSRIGLHPVLYHDSYQYTALASCAVLVLAASLAYFNLDELLG